MTHRDTIGLLLSGGLDSSILLGQLLDEGHCVQPLYVRCGLAWEPAEQIHAARWMKALARPALRRLVTLDVPAADLYADHWSVTGVAPPDDTTPDEAVFLPGRNALLALKAGLWCQIHGIDALALAPLRGNPFDDAAPPFFNALESLLAHCGPRPIRLVRPFAQLDKPGVLALGRRYPLEHTMSCLAPIDELHCGACNKCAERRAAFRQANMPDPARYAAAM